MPEKGGLAVWHFADPLEPLCQHLAEGGVLALPTESSYGLGVDPRSRVGVESIYRLKRRERGKPLPVVASSLEQVLDLGVDRRDPLLRRVATHWPAPLTAILSLASEVASLPASAGLRTVAVRIPAHRRLRRLLAQLGHALTATSANLSGQAPILDRAGLDRQFPGTGLLIVDGGPVAGGPPSTVVSFRAGRIEIERLGSFDPALL